MVRPESNKHVKQKIANKFCEYCGDRKDIENNGKILWNRRLSR